MILALFVISKKSLCVLSWIIIQMVDLLGGNLHRSITSGKRISNKNNHASECILFWFDLSLWLVLGKLSVQGGTINNRCYTLWKREEKKNINFFFSSSNDALLAKVDYIWYDCLHHSNNITKIWKVHSFEGQKKKL
jgi:hypothetical protein